MSLKNLTILSIIGFISFSSCKKDDPVTPVIPNEEEVITTLIYTLTDTADATNTITLRYRDLDGDGSNAPIISSGTLNDSSVYTSVGDDCFTQTFSDDGDSEIIKNTISVY